MEHGWPSDEGKGGSTGGKRRGKIAIFAEPKRKVIEHVLPTS
jgi:hypothetical protein